MSYHIISYEFSMMICLNIICSYLFESLVPLPCQEAQDSSRAAEAAKTQLQEAEATCGNGSMWFSFGETRHPGEIPADLMCVYIYHVSNNLICCFVGFSRRFFCNCSEIGKLRSQAAAAEALRVAEECRRKEKEVGMGRMEDVIRCHQNVVIWTTQIWDQSNQNKHRR